MRKVEKHYKSIAKRAASVALACTMVITGLPATIASAKTGSALDIGHPTFKNTDLLDAVYNLKAEDYTAESQLMKLYQQDLANGGESFYIDRVLAREGACTGNPDSNGDYDGDTFMTRARALYMYTSDVDVIGFGGNTAYHQPMNKGDMYAITFAQDGTAITTKEDSSKRVNMPSHWRSEYAVGSTGVTASVQKFMNYQNTAVTLVTLSNPGTADVTLDVSAASGFTANGATTSYGGAEYNELTGELSSPSNLTTLYPRLSATAAGETFNLADGSLTKSVTIPAGGSVELKAVMSFETKEIPEAAEQYKRFLTMEGGNAKALQTQKEEYNLWWAETMPYIDVPNKAIQKAIDYRWWLENFNKLDANIPGYDYQFPVTIEGVLGYNNAIVLTQSMHLQDTKWMRDGETAYGQLLSVGNCSQSSAFLDNPGNRGNWNNHYGQYIATAGLEAYKVIGGDAALAENLAYYFEHDAKGQLDHYGNHTSSTTPENYLIDYSLAYMTGNDADTISFAYPGSGTWKSHAENAYVYGAAEAAAELYQMTGNSVKADELATLAKNIQTDILNYLWCEQDNAFETRAVAPTTSFVSHNTSQPNLIPYKENNNFNYFSEGVVPTDEASVAKYGKMLEYLKYADEFPIFPYYTANQVDNKKQAGSNNFSNINFTVQARAYESAIRTYDPEHQYVTPEMYATMVEWCAWNMYPNGGDIRYPNNNEFFNVDGKTNDTYYRSWIYHNILGNYNWIFVEDVAGIVPRADDTLELNPIDFNYDHFMINNVRYHGQDVTVVWDDPTDDTDYYTNLPEGYSVYIDGELAFNLSQKAHVEYKDGELTYTDGKPEGIVEQINSKETKTANEVTYSDDIKAMLQKAGIEADVASENLAEGATVEATYTPSAARAATWATKHRSDNSGSDETSKAVNEEKPDPAAITDGTTVDMPFWGNDQTPNEKDSVVIKLAEKKDIDMLDIYFYNDRQAGGYTEPAKYTVEYWTGSEWQPVEKQNRYPVIPQANYNSNKFAKVNTDQIRVTVYNKASHYTAITEVQLYNEGGDRQEVANTAPVITAIKQDGTKNGNLATGVTATVEDDGMPWTSEMTYKWEVVSTPSDTAEATLATPDKISTVVEGTEAGNYTLKLTVNDGEFEASAEITVALKSQLKKGVEDLALKATPTSDYTASWEKLAGINNPNFEPTQSKGGTGQGWGNWPQTEGTVHWVQYDWSEEQEIAFADIFWYDDGGDTRVPSAIEFQYKDANGEWQTANMLSNFADVNKIDQYNTIALDPIKTKALRLNMTTQKAASGIYRFKVFGIGVDEVLPVTIATKTGTLPTLPETVIGRYADGTTKDLAVTWEDLNEESFKTDGIVTVKGTTAEMEATATIYVRSDMDKAGITSIDPSSIKYTIGTELSLPKTVVANYNNGAKNDVAVTWPEFTAADLMQPGATTYANIGTVAGTDIKASLTIEVAATADNLQAAIDIAKAYTEADYTPESYKDLQAAVAAAEDVIKNSGDEAAIKSAMTAVAEKVKALTKAGCKEHKWVKDDVASAKNAPTCEKDGKIIYKCSVCNETKEETVKALGHKLQWVVTKEATATSTGLKVQKCTVCNKVVKEEVIAKLASKVTLNAKSVPLQKGKKTSAVKVKTIAKGDKLVSASSDKKCVAVSVKGGKLYITGKSVGKAVVTVTTKNGATAKVTVKVQKSKVKTTKVAVTKKKVSLKKGKSAKITTVITPVTSLEKVTFKSSNAKIAKVTAKGVVKGVKAGKCTITVKSGKKTAKVTVTVK